MTNTLKDAILKGYSIKIETIAGTYTSHNLIQITLSKDGFTCIEEINAKVYESHSFDLIEFALNEFDNKLYKLYNKQNTNQ